MTIEQLRRRVDALTPAARPAADMSVEEFEALVRDAQSNPPAFTWMDLMKAVDQ